MAYFDQGSESGHREQLLVDGLRVPVGATLDEAERLLIEATLEYFDGDKRRAANMLGCSLKTLYNRLSGYNRDLLSARV
jgi:DNA-binding NtrC family response regulator